MLKTKRIKKHLTELELAERIGKSESYVSKLENHPSRCNPTVKLILNLANELSLDPAKVFIFFIKDRKD